MDGHALESTVDIAGICGAAHFDPVLIHVRVRNALIGAFEVRDGETELFHVVGALHATSGFARGLHCRKKETDQNTDDRDDDQEFN